jgi:hypothetical protein
MTVTMTWVIAFGSESVAAAFKVPLALRPGLGLQPEIISYYDRVSLFYAIDIGSTGFRGRTFGVCLCIPGTLTLTLYADLPPTLLGRVCVCVRAREVY